MPDFDSVLNYFIDVSIQKAALTGVMVHDYLIDKQDLQRQRITDHFLSECIQICAERDIECDFVPHRGVFNIRIDLRRCRLTFTQSRNFSVAMNRIELER